MTDGTEDGTQVIPRLGDGERFNVGYGARLTAAAGKLFMPVHRGTTPYTETVLVTLQPDPFELKQLGSDIDVGLNVHLLTNEGDGVVSDDRLILYGKRHPSL